MIAAQKERRQPVRGRQGSHGSSGRQGGGYSSRRQAWPLFLVIACGTWSIAEGLADEVTYATSSDGGARRVAKGTVLDFNGQSLVLRTESGGEQRIPADRVLAIETTKTAPQQAAEAALENKDFGKAAEHYLAAFREERRAWVQRQIMAAYIECLMNSENPERACVGFQALVKRDPETPYFASIPLRWTPYQPTPEFQREAISWLQDRENSPAALLGASWLLSTGQRAAAVQALERLSIDPDSRVVQLAQAQLWRTRLVSAGAEDVGDLRKLIDRMPSTLRGGPYFLLGRLLSRQGDSQSAALAYLRVPILYPRDHQLAADALLSAGRELERIGQTGEAATLYREVAQEYPATISAGEAASRLQRLQPDKEEASP
jgi:tetratricopeptide (TPR) repeat protein